MNRRDFSHANNPTFECGNSVLLLPFGRRSFLPAIVDACGGEAVTLDETTDREVFRLAAAPSDCLCLRAAALLFCTDNVTLPREEDRGYRGLKDPRVQRGFDAGLKAAIAALSASPE